MKLPSECAASLRAASGDAERKVCREKLAYAIRSVAVRQVRLKNVDGFEAEDVAQDVSLRVLEAILQNSVEHGKEDAYVKTAAVNAALSHHRKAGARNRRYELADDVGERIEERQKPDLPADEEQNDRLELFTAEQIRALVQRAPANYRRVIEHHHLKERSLDNLIAEIFEAEAVQNDIRFDDERARTRLRGQVRNRIYKHHERALAWLQNKLAQEKV